MDNKLQRKAMRRSFSAIGWALLIYYLILNAAVFLVVIVDTIYRTVLVTINTGVEPDEQAILEIGEQVMQNGWGYMLALIAGYIFLRMWKGKKFCRSQIWKRGKPMTCGSFFTVLCLLVSAQLLFQLLAILIELLLNSGGLTAMPSVESATMTAASFSMFLYMCVGAPIGEELLFRGLVLRTLEPYGKRFSIVMSALLFGLFHGNLVQSPYAFGVGLVLGYVAVEHNIGWAMVLHMFNNLVLSDMLQRITLGVSEILGGLLGLVLLWGMTIAAIVLVIVYCRQILAYRRADRIRGECVGSFFTAPGILAFSILMVLSMVGLLFLQV